MHCFQLIKLIIRVVIIFLIFASDTLWVLERYKSMIIHHIMCSFKLVEFCILNVDLAFFVCVAATQSLSK